MLNCRHPLLPMRVCTLLSVLIPFVSVSAYEALSVKLAVPDTETLRLIATVKNTGKETLKIINDPRGPLSPFPANTFTITNVDGQVPKFIGPIVKFNPQHAASAGSLTTLAPEQSAEIVHDLTNTYNFSATGPGSYTFKLRTTRFYIMTSLDAVNSLEAQTFAVTADFATTAIRPPKIVGLDKRATYRSCSSARQTQLATAAINAQAYASESLSYLTAHTTPTPRFETWFGAFSTSKHVTVASHFSKISSNNFSNYTYDCSCTEAVYAYVYPSSFGVVYLCNLFWAAPMTGADSKAGTLIHEASHFTVNGGADDLGPKGVFSADSHQGFAENTPPLP